MAVATPSTTAPVATPSTTAPTFAAVGTNVNPAPTAPTGYSVLGLYGPFV